MDSEASERPSQGDLQSTSVPQLLAEAWRDSSNASLEVIQGKAQKIIRIRDGSPFAVESNGTSDGFARSLEETRQISGPDRSKAESFAVERECSEASAVHALGLLDATGLFKAMRTHARNQIGEVMAWQAGDYRWLPEEGTEEDRSTASKPFDVLSLLQEQLPRRWDTDRLFQALMPYVDQYADVAPRNRKVTEKLAAQSPAAQQLVSQLDGARPIGQVLGNCAGDPIAATTLWILVYGGLVRLQDEAPLARTETGTLHFEVEVEAPAATDAATPAAGRTQRRAGGRASGNADRSASMKNDIEAIAAKLDELDHYGALGLDSEASPADIKKAYFKAAKRYHPDALARMGLDSLRETAARVFARISEAFEILSDSDKKAAYDAGGSDHAEIDTARLAQAETSFRKGEILVKMGNFEGALEFLAPAVDLWPDEPAYQAGLGWALFRQPRSDPEQARVHLEIAHEQTPEDATVLYQLGLVVQALGDSALGNRYVDQARSLDPSVSE